MIVQYAAVDALQRRLPEDVPAARENRLVGMFYFLWLGEHGRGKPYDISKIIAENPRAGYAPDDPVWGGIGTYHHWGEPFYGYYYSDDEWVVRRHMKLLAQAGVDFLFFDTTNALVYEKNAKLVMRVLQEYQDAGLSVPKVMFYTNSASGKTVEKIYHAIYEPGYCKDTWFYYQGKPLIIAVPEECSEETRAFFNIKLSQWPNEPDKLGGWPWMDFVRPQRAFPDLQGVPEVINVSVAQHPQLRFGDSALYGETGNCGRSYHAGKEDLFPGSYRYGYNFGEQFDRALEADVPVTLVTGWNEWIAGRWQGPADRPLMFVDCANTEYSRDLEMMRGGYFDNYYCQLCAYIRRYKGADPAPVHACGETTVFSSFPDGDFQRHAEGYGTVYENTTARRAITALTVSHDQDTLTLGLTLREEVPAQTEGTYLRFYIGVGEKTEWGYDYIVCPAAERDGVAQLYRANGVQCAESLASLPCSFDGVHLSVQIPFAKLGVTERRFRLQCKAADAASEIASVEDLYDQGDCAPLGRLDYMYMGDRGE